MPPDDQRLLNRLRGVLAAADGPAPGDAVRARAAFTVAMLERAVGAGPTSEPSTREDR